ncbi:unnamed protein product [Gadus morhua 'NCC']
MNEALIAGGRCCAVPSGALQLAAAGRCCSVSSFVYELSSRREFLLQLIRPYNAVLSSTADRDGGPPWVSQR